MSASHTAINSPGSAAAIPAFNAAIFPREMGNPSVIVRSRRSAHRSRTVRVVFSGTVVDEHRKEPIRRIFERVQGGERRGNARKLRFRTDQQRDRRR